MYIYQLDGTILDVNTDCAVCGFHDDVITFKLTTEGHIDGDYDDTE